MYCDSLAVMKESFGAKLNLVETTQDTMSTSRYNPQAIEASPSQDSTVGAAGSSVEQALDHD